MDDTAPKPKLTLADLIVFGRDYLRATEEPGKGIGLDKDTLKQYLIAANEGLALLEKEQERERKRKKPRSTGGRPSGDGMGDQVLRLIANGMGEQRALRAVAEDRGKSRTSVQRSYNAARKKARR